MANTNRDALIARITEVVERVAKSVALEVVEVELLGGGKARVLRIYIDKPDGVTHADCEHVSHQVGAILDAEDVIPGEGYTLEVSSCGVERKLSKAEEFRRFAGKKAKISLKEAVEDQKFWEGTLQGMEGDSILLEPVPGQIVRIPLNAVRKANLKFEW